MPDVEGTFRLVGMRIVVARCEKVFRAGLPVDPAERGLGIVVALNARIFAWIVKFPREKINQVRADASGVILFGPRRILLVVRAEVEQLVLLAGPANRASELLPRERAKARAV